MLYKGQVQRFATFVAADIPAAAAKLDKMVDALEAYVNLAASDASVPHSVAQPPSGGEVTSQPLPEEPTEP